jgi:hypothetical protein
MKPRFVVCDEEGELRSFHSKAEAVAFIGEREDELVIKVLPKRPRPNPFELVGECLF